ncbi:MAG: DeoR/GlpR family DNA-binding transcription regulator [Cellulosilyticaceae bacterium]
MQRYDQILELLSQHKTMSIHRLKDALFCSTSSLRRDLIALEATGAIRRIRGGATLVRGSHFEYSSDFRKTLQSTEKDYIASIAFDFISNGMSLFLDSSSTVSKLCPQLETLHSINVATNGVHTSLLLSNSPHINTCVTGGSILNRSGTLFGTDAISYISHLKADIAFISCRGMDIDGIYEADVRQAQIKQAMIHNAKKTILLIDHSKIDSHFFYRLGTFSQFHAIITDEKPSSELIRAIEEQHCLLLY